MLDGTIPYGFPACCGIEELRERMEREKIRVFVIDSSLDYADLYWHRRWKSHDTAGAEGSLAKWDDFIADPGRYLNGMIEGEFEE